MTSEPTDMQKAFMDALMAGETPAEAKRIAGYSEHTATRKILTGVQDHFIEYVGYELMVQMPKAVQALVTQLESPSPMGATQIAAAREVLDRAGLTKKEKAVHEISAPNGLFILPAKSKPNEDNHG